MGWLQCNSCVFGTNSPKLATAHSESTGHTIRTEDE